MIYSIYIFHKAGHLLFSEELKPRTKKSRRRDSPDLISGLFSAISQFAESLGGRGIQKIQMEEKYSITGITSPKYNIRFVIMTDLSDDTGECNYFLRRCRTSFIQKYRKDLKKLKKNTLVNTEIFEDWKYNLRNLSEDLELLSIEQVMSGSIKKIAKISKKKIPN
ncbi:MAG: hypothetical protein ACTSRG_12745 [Candidatus Helarchaeota archaeon]